MVKKQKNKTRSNNSKKKNNPLDEIITNATQIFLKGNIEKAVEYCQTVLNKEPEHAGSLHLMGLIAYHIKQYNQAIGLITKAISIKANDEAYYYNLGACYAGLKKHKEAIECYKKALQLKPEYDLAYGNLANSCLALEDYDDALHAAYHAIKIDSTRKEAAAYYNVIGIVLNIFGKYTAAEEAFVKSLQINPNHPETYNNLAEVFMVQGKFQAAKEAYQVSDKLDPNDPSVRWNLGFAHLALGELRDGWDCYTTGIKKEGVRTANDFQLPIWNGEDLSNKSIVVQAEQGLGDEMLFSSCLPDLIKISKHCILECENRLVPIFTRSFPEVTVFPKHSTKETSADYQIQAGELARFFRQEISDFPTKTGYLKENNDYIKFWCQKLNEIGTGIKVGISWKSGLLTTRRAHHYTSLEDWEPILKVPGVQFVNLQYGDCQDVLDSVENKTGIHIHNFDDLDLKDDLDQVMSLTSSLDLVICIGNAVSSISSSIGKKTWKLSLINNPLLMLGTEHEPWYPNTKIFQQHLAGEWGVVITQIANELQDFATASNK